MRTLRLYLAREVVLSTGLVLLALVLLFAFFDFIQELGDVGRGRYSLSLALLKVALSLPAHLYELAPIAALLGTLFALVQMVAHSEYTVMRVAGLSAWGMAASLAPVGLAFSLATFAVGEFVAPWSESVTQRIRLGAAEKRVVAREFRSGLWVKDEDSFVNVAQVGSETLLSGVRVYEFDRDYRLVSMSEARSAEYLGGDRWRLRDVARTKFLPEGTRAVHEDEAVWHSVLSPSILNVLMVVPERMSVSELHGFIGHLRANRQATARHEIALYGKVVYPLAVMVMMWLALPFAYVRIREGGLGGKMFAGILLGLGFHLASRLFGHLGLLNAWSPMVSAVLPTAMFLVTGAALLWWLERR